MWIICYLSIPYLESSHFTVIGAISAASVHLDTLTTKLYQVNTRVSRIARCQARMCGFAASPSPFPSPQASKDKDDDNGSGDDDDDDKDKDDNSSSDEEMTTSQ